MSDYRDALAYLFARTTGGSKFGLERTESLLATLGQPHRAFASLHVAGTNGKGSVCATLEAALRARGLRVGKYTSPHLVDFRERVIIDGQPVAEDSVVSFIDRWTPEVERLGATFFEATTALAFACFADAGVDAAVIETGLGGRLDSTNVVRPVVAGVTSIGIDHVEFLGSTLASIATEKAGIFKAGVPAVIGEREPDIAHQLRAHARRAGTSAIASVWRDAPPGNVQVAAGGTAFTVDMDGECARLETPLTGEHQAGNTMVALLMLRLAGPRYFADVAEFARALPDVRLPGRFQRVGRFIFDVAHNPDGARVLAATMAHVNTARPVVALLSVLADKDWRGIMDALAPAVDGFIVTNAPTAPASRAWHAEGASEYARARGWSARLEPEFEQALDVAVREGATVLITGSFHTVGDAMTRLQVDPLAR